MMPGSIQNDANARAHGNAALRVLVVTPVGVEGKGGIDRLNSYIDLWNRSVGNPLTLTYLGSRGDGGPLQWPLHFLKALRQFRHMMKSGTYDIVLIHVSTDGSAFRKVVFGVIARRYAMPYVIQYHGMMSEEIIAAKPLWLRLLGNLARGAARAVVLGQAFVPYFERQLAVAVQKIQIIRNGVPDIGGGAVIPRAQDGPLNILFAGEVGERKGVDVLLSALALLGGHARAWSCVIAGNGDIEKWKAESARLDLTDRIEFTGWVSSDRIRELARQSDVIVLPSRAEALPLSLIEGASAGAALIATDVGAVREIVKDQHNGLIVSRDAPSLAQALGRLLEERSLLVQMQQASRAHYLSAFTMDHFARALCETLEDVAKRN